MPQIFMIAGLLFAHLCFAGEAISSPPIAGQWKAVPDSPSLEDGSGNGHQAVSHGVSVLWRQEDLVDHPCFYLNGQGAHLEVANARGLNPAQLSIVLWFKPPEGLIDGQRPLVLKSLESHREPWYQYGLFLMNDLSNPQSLSFYVSVGEASYLVSATGLDWHGGWNHAAATYDGGTLRLFLNGRECAVQATAGGPIDPADTPLLIGAYGNLPKDARYCFQGFIGSVTLYAGALDEAAVETLYAAEKEAYPVSEAQEQTSEYAQRLNEVLHLTRDVWGEELIASGGATYEKIKDYLQPLFYSTGHTNTRLGVHNILYAEDGGNPPYIVALADGSRLAALVYQSENDLRFGVGPEGAEAYGSDLARLEGPFLDEGYYPILQTAYTDASGLRYEQESFASWVPGMAHLVALARFTVPPATTRLRMSPGKTEQRFLWTSLEGEWDGKHLTLLLDGREEEGLTVYLAWSPEEPLPGDFRLDAATYHEAKKRWKEYWDAALSRGALFDVPEALVMDCQRNLLIQNLMLRWRYSLGSVVYHDSYYQPESNDAMSTLAFYGFQAEAREGLSRLIGLSKGEQYYSNWERGEKLSHGAEYYYLSRDDDFIAEHAAQYEEIIEELHRQMQVDPHGLLKKQVHCGDIPTVSYCTFHQSVCWRGLRDMARIWTLTGRRERGAEFEVMAASLRDALLKAVSASEQRLPDKCLFIPSMLLEDDNTLYSPITETRIGSYWNLCMPYAFATGLWPGEGEDLPAILRFMHEHGATLLGLLRFNYYPTPIGAYHAQGLPGYATTGYDNVYLPSYIRVLAELDEAERLVLSFYGKLAHGQTRNTFISGEGDTVGVFPGLDYRSSYGAVCSANNVAFLLPLRLMLIRESFNPESGAPEGLYLAHATPREWLDAGKRIEVRDAPTCFGAVSYTIESGLDRREIRVRLSLPDRNPISTLHLRLRAPAPFRLKSATLNGAPFTDFDPATETFNLTATKGVVDLVALYD
jgi:hypothetical protein